MLPYFVKMHDTILKIKTTTTTTTSTYVHRIYTGLPDSGRENTGDSKKMVIFMQNGIGYLLESHAEIQEIP